ncbi:hypothetical protein Pmani_026349 [Petrolisthes manimaculis]|uniref:Uncharacterized protein n=1 Tax=Petrolisthes manimaculis TaxID=1843537 RepID=A0AAE1P6D1_9EUCA|nr:hypothetical protein Pmani_026349 [Petrolisthes manimaculis]
MTHADPDHRRFSIDLIEEQVKVYAKNARGGGKKRDAWTWRGSQEFDVDFLDNYCIKKSSILHSTQRDTLFF